MGFLLGENLPRGTQGSALWDSTLPSISASKRSEVGLES